MSVRQSSARKTRLVERGFPDRSFEIEFWQEQGDEAIFAAGSGPESEAQPRGSRNAKKKPSGAAVRDQLPSRQRLVRLRKRSWVIARKRALSLSVRG